MAGKFWQNKKVLVTGIAGFLGSWLAEDLLGRGAAVVGLIRDRIPGSNFNLLKLDDQVAVVHGSAADGEVVSRVFQEYEIEYVFHLAAQAIVGQANQDPLPTFESNIKGTWTVLEAARRSKTLQGIVVASSDKAYGTQAVPYREEAPLLGENPYEVSKVCTDYLARSYARSFGMPLAVTRCANLFGGGDLNFSRLVPGTIRSLVRDETPIIRSDGSPVRDYLYIKDAVSAYLALAERLEKTGIQGEAFNFGLGRPISVLDLVKKIVKISKKDSLQPVILGKGKMEREIDQQYLEAGKARRVLNWIPSFSLDSALSETFHWYQNFFTAQNPALPAASREPS